MDSTFFKDLLLNNWGKILGALLGLLIGLLFIWYGFWKTLLILLCLTGGVLLGIQLEKNENFNNLLDKFRNN